ncbi:MAG: hypothetical protein RIT81_23815 [Deltaproteobacteria bacterium]
MLRYVVVTLLILTTGAALWIGGRMSSPDEPAAKVERVRVVERPAQRPVVESERSFAPLWTAMRSLGARIEALETAPPEVAPEPDLVEAAPFDPEVALAEAREGHSDALHRHAETPFEASWAEPAAAGLREELGRIAEDRAFTVAEVDCRSRSCVVTLDWPTYDGVMEDAGAVLHRTTLPCANEAFVPPPDDPAAPYRTEILFDCGG